MDLQHINMKLFIDGDLSIDPARFIDMFHRWIRDKVCDELLIDVADYRHVPAGPGVMLIAHEANYSLDNTNNRWGLLYNCKADTAGTNEQRLTQAFHSTVKACKLIEAEFAAEDALTFCREELEIIVNDRALAPNTDETFQTCKPDIESFIKNAIDQSDYTIEHQTDPRKRLALTIKLAKPFDW